MSFGKFHIDRARYSGRHLPASRSMRFASLRPTYMHWQQFNRLSVPLTQQPLAILRQRHLRYRCPRLQSLFDDPALLPHRPPSSLRLSLNDCSLPSVHLFPKWALS